MLPFSTFRYFTLEYFQVGHLRLVRYLFKKDDVDSEQTHFWQRMEKHKEYATIQYFQVGHLRVLSGTSS
jgi:hypothetical protein